MQLCSCQNFLYKMHVYILLLLLPDTISLQYICSCSLFPIPISRYYNNMRLHHRLVWPEQPDVRGIGSAGSQVLPNPQVGCCFNDGKEQLAQNYNSLLGPILDKLLLAIIRSINTSSTHSGWSGWTGGVAPGSCSAPSSTPTDRS